MSTLTEELVQVRDGRLCSFAMGNGHLEPVVDGEFIYLEAELACESTTEIDISIHETRAFIRIERSLAGPGLGDEVETDSSSIIGWVEFSEQGATIRATLTAGRMWSCAVAPDVADMLNSEFAPAGDLPDHASVCDALIKAAERLQGLAWLDPDKLLDD